MKISSCMFVAWQNYRSSGYEIEGHIACTLAESMVVIAIEYSDRLYTVRELHTLSSLNCRFRNDK
jgi:hypothetical protein